MRATTESMRSGVTLLLALALCARGWRWRHTTSAPFDHSVTTSSCANDGGRMPLPPTALLPPSLPVPSQPPAALAPLSHEPLSPPPVAAHPAEPVTTQPLGSTPLPSARRGWCHAKFAWVEEESWEGGLRARLDVSGDGVIEGWVLNLTFPATLNVSVATLIGGVALTQAGAPTLVVLPRLASGLGTIHLTLTATLLPHSNGRRGSASRAPRIECVPEPPSISAHALLEPDAWRTSARADYLWMAKEFNRQYINSHGKEHDDYQVCAHVHASEGGCFPAMGAQEGRQQVTGWLPRVSQLRSRARQTVRCSSIT